MKNPFIILLVIVPFAAAAAGISSLISKSEVSLPSGWKINPLGKSVPTGDLLAGGERSPNGKWISFLAVGQGTHKLYIVSAESGKIVSETSLPIGWIGQTWSPDSTSLSISGGTQHAINTFDVSDQGQATKTTTIQIPDYKPGTGWFSGIARTNTHFFINSSASDQILKISIESGKIEKTLQLETSASPYQLRTHDQKLYASLQGSDRVIELNTETLTETRNFSTGDHPNDILFLNDRMVVSCGNEDTVEIFDLYTGSREERLNVRPWPDAPAGSTPHALAASPNQKLLYVALSDNNCVGVIDIENRAQSHIKGFIPTALYPSALACLKDGTLITGCGKGVGTGPNGNTDKIDPVAPQGYPYIVTLLKGTLQTTPLQNDAQLRAATNSVLELSAYKTGNINRPNSAPKPGSNPIPSKTGDPSPIKYVLYIIKENRTYDQLFGDLKRNGKQYGNGDPKLTLFGQDIAPNHRQLVQDYVLLDNFYASGEVSVDGHHWTKGAYVPDFMQRTWPQQYSGKGAPRLTEKLSVPPNGYIWDTIRRANKSYRTYYYHTQDRQSEAWAEARRNRERDYKAVDIFIKEFREFETKGTMPNFMILALSEDHTSGTRPGAFTPQACVASNDLGLGKIVETISNSKLWDKFAIFVVEDDAQNGPDHVDAHRTVCLAISPYTRNRGIDSTHYTTTSLVRTIGLIMGAQPLTQHDAAATPLYKAFRNTPILTPYRALTPNTDLLAINPPRATDPSVDAIDFSEPDQLDIIQEQALNRDIWHAIKGKSIPYPGITRRFGAPKPGTDDDD